VIRHIVFFSARDPADLARLYDGLKLLTGTRHARRLEVAYNDKADRLGNDVDVVVYGEFDDAEKLAAYKADPLYEQAIAVVRPLREMRVAADFRADEA
jgi:hypothetical protein